jgi:O-antigen/teichoic acid export membrane protein
MNKVSRNFLTNGAASIFGQIITFITIAYYARVIGKDLFGSVTLAQQIILYFSMTVLFGIQTLGIRIISRKEIDISTALSEIISFRLFITAICIFIIILLSFVVGKGYQFNIILWMFSLTLFAYAFNADYIFNGIQEMQYNAVFNLCKSIVPAVIIFVFLRNKEQVYIIPIAILLGLVVGIAYQYYILTVKYRIHIEAGLSFSIIVKYAKYGSPFFISAIFSMINNNVDKIIIGFTRSHSELGEYQAAYTFISFLISLEALIFVPVFPLLISVYHKNNYDTLERLSAFVGKIITIVVLPVFAGGLILSKDIIVVIFSEEYAKAYIALNILLVYILFLYIREIYGYQLNAWQQERKYLKAVSVSALFNLTLCIVFVPRYGIIAAAVITVFTEIINLIFMKTYSDRILKLSLRSILIRNSMPAAIMGVFTFILKYFGASLILNISTSFLLYIVMLFVLKVITKKELIVFLFRKEVPV